ncbi:uncharacterized protein LOC120655878 isoform X1 [Panicum virgatum]|uniref:uncharacterized protein LOC120655878 isoform X1 n=1 Tax=Panicum virgatum TaxID=38727 RepID=UPI0019D67696|nr:uncharacterized protein LOC120655878 isoform X1 [Panicum virgatum]
MDPNTKLILDELHKGFSNEQVGHLESAAAVFDEGKPRIEAFVEDVKLEVGKLSHHWDRSVRDITNTGPGIIPNPKSVTERPPALDGSADGSDGHCDTNCYRDWEGGFGSVYVQTHLLIKGSLATFMKKFLADKLTGVQPLPSALHVQVARGGIMACSSHLPAA